MNHRQKHIDFLDHFRGIAVVAVFLFHSLGTACGRNQLPWANWIADFDVSRTFLVLLPFSLGWSGVAIFFVVSGFCIHLNFRRKPDWRDFTLDRKSTRLNSSHANLVCRLLLEKKKQTK